MEKTYVFDTAESGGEAAHMSGDLAQLILEEALYSIVEL